MLGRMRGLQTITEERSPQPRRFQPLPAPSRNPVLPRLREFQMITEECCPKLRWIPLRPSQ